MPFASDVFVESESASLYAASRNKLEDRLLQSKLDEIEKWRRKASHDLEAGKKQFTHEFVEQVKEKSVITEAKNYLSHRRNSHPIEQIRAEALAAVSGATERKSKMRPTTPFPVDVSPPRLLKPLGSFEDVSDDNSEESEEFIGRERSNTWGGSVKKSSLKEIAIKVRNRQQNPSENAPPIASSSRRNSLFLKRRESLGSVAESDDSDTSPQPDRLNLSAYLVKRRHSPGFLSLNNDCLLRDAPVPSTPDADEEQEQKQEVESEQLSMVVEVPE